MSNNSLFYITLSLFPPHKVETDHAKIKRELQARDEEREKMTKELMAINDKLKVFGFEQELLMYRASRII